MSLVRYKARNHPQQLVDPDVDDRGTTLEDFRRFDTAMGPFTLDVAATAANTKCARYFTADQNGLQQSWGSVPITQEGNQCRCKCHSSSNAPSAGRNARRATSPQDPRSRTVSTASAKPAIESGLASASGNADPTPRSVHSSSMRNVDTPGQTEAVPPNDAPHESRTTSDGNGQNTHSSGQRNYGTPPNSTGADAAPGVACAPTANRTTSSPSLTPSAPEPSRGTSSRPADRATGERGLSHTVNGLAHNDSQQSSGTCERCASCTLESGQRVWSNPPFSAIGPWVQKAWDEWKTTDGIAMLLPANRTEQNWWQHLIEPHRDRAGSPLRVLFLPGRMRFLRAGQQRIGPNERPPFGCLIAAWALDPSSVLPAQPSMFEAVADAR